MTNALIAAVTDADFETTVLQSEQPVLVDFWAEWCAPCRMIAPIVEELATDLDGRVRVVKMNIDENPDMPSKLGIMSIPTLIIFKNGQAEDRTVGYRSNLKLDLREKLEALIS
jgi:thioredoxin 1